MVLEKAIDLIHRGKFEPAIDLLDDNFGQYQVVDQEHVEADILRSRAYYHMARLDQAIYFVDQVINNLGDIEIEELSMIEALILKSIYQFGTGEFDDASETFDQLNKKIEEIEGFTDQDLRIKGHYDYMKGLLAEHQGKLKEAIGHFTESGEIKSAIDNYYELNFVYYKLGLLYRMLGKLDQSREYLLSSLEISENLDLQTEIATTSTLLGQDHLMSHEYEESRVYLDRGLAQWNGVGSLFGKIWALAELAMLDYFTGNKEESFTRYEEIYEMGKEYMPPFHLSGHLLNLIKFGLEAGDYEKARSYLEELEHLADENDNVSIKDRFGIAQSLMNIKTGRASKIFETISKIRTSGKSSNYFIKLESLAIHIQLLLLEYKITEKEVLKNQILEETQEKATEVLDYIHQNAGISYEFYCHFISQYLDTISQDPKYAIEELESISDRFSDETEAFSIQSQDNKEEDPLDWRPSEFNFSKELHSIPKLKILLFLLPRSRVSFTELMKGTKLTAGNLTGQCDKLVELDYIVKEKDFLEEKMTTFYFLTSKGYIEVKDYFTELFGYFNKILY